MDSRDAACARLVYTWSKFDGGHPFICIDYTRSSGLWIYFNNFLSLASNLSAVVLVNLAWGTDLCSRPSIKYPEAQEWWGCHPGVSEGKVPRGWGEMVQMQWYACIIVFAWAMYGCMHACICHEAHNQPDWQQMRALVWYDHGMVPMIMARSFGNGL